MSDTVKLVIEIDEEVWDWFVTKSFIPIMYYDSLADSMKNAVPLSEVLSENKGDLISRQAVIDALTKTSGIRGDALKALYDLPSVENKREWIPVIERLPKDGELVLCSVADSNHSVIINCFENQPYWRNGKIYAWQPLPEPYKAEKGGE